MTGARTFGSGDAVGWSSSGKVAVGRVVEKLTGPTETKGHQVAASEEDTEDLVESDKCGAAHGPGSLTKRGESDGQAPT